MRRMSPESTLPGPISTNVRAPRSRSALDGLREAHGRRQLLQSRIGTISRAPSSAAGDGREERHLAARRTSSPRATGASCSAGERGERAVEAARDLELDGAPRAGRLGRGHQRVDALQRAARRRPARGSCSSRPRRPSMPSQSRSISSSSRPMTAAIAPGVAAAAAAVARPRSRVRCAASRSSIDARGDQRRVLADRVADHVVGRGARSRAAAARHASSVADERRLRDVGLASAARAGPRSRASARSKPTRLRGAVVDGPRGRKRLAHRTPHAHLLRALSREAERHLALRHASSSQRPRIRLHRAGRGFAARALRHR